ncbi:MAG TPA: hypothetical protein VMA71_09905 [Alloacidobacterium sp.]|nr:hypothetical protein [Alloacidobacterium sp.]
MARTHSPQFELLRHFLTQNLISELTGSGQMQRLTISLLCVLGCVGPLIVRLYVPKYAYLQSMPAGDLYLAAVRADRLFFVATSMLVAGMVSVYQWQNLFPSREDYLALKPLPIRLYQVFVGRCVASFLIAAAIIVDVNVGASVLFPSIATGRWQSPPFGVRYVLAHATATVSAGLFVYVAMFALQGVLMSLLPNRVFPRVSVVMQALAAAGLLIGSTYVLDIPNWHRTIAARAEWLWHFPPMWFLGFYERLLGTSDPYFRRLSSMASAAFGAACVLAVLSYLLSYRRQAARALEQVRPGAWDWSGKLAEKISSVVIRDSTERAAFVFALQTLRGSRRHKLLMLFGIALALVVVVEEAIPAVVSPGGHAMRQHQSLLAMPLIAGAILVSTFCYVFQFPCELKANWVFRMADGPGRLPLLNSVDRLLILCGLLPVVLISSPIVGVAFGWRLAIAHGLLVTVLVLLLIEFRLNGWHKIPFTCSYVPGRRNFWQIAGAYLSLFAIIIPTVTYFESRVLKPIILIGLAAGFSALYWKLRALRCVQASCVPLMFDESEEAVVSPVQLNRD